MNLSFFLFQLLYMLHRKKKRNLACQQFTLLIVVVRYNLSFFNNMLFYINCRNLIKKEKCHVMPCGKQSEIMGVYFTI